MEEGTPLAGNNAGDGWHLGLRRNRLLPWLGPVLAAPAAAAAVASWHEPAALVGYGGFAAAVAPAPGWGYRGGDAPHDYEGPLGAGLAMPLKPLSWLSIVSFGILGALFLFGLVAVVVAWPAIDNHGGALVGCAFLLVFGLLFAGGVYGGIVQHLRHDRAVLLTPDGVVLSSDRKPVRIPWPAITGIRAHWTARRRGLFHFDDEVRNWLTLDADLALVEGRTSISVWARTKSPTVEVTALAPEPRLVLAVLRHYLEHAEDRAELRSVVALDRVAALGRSVADRPLA